MMKDTTYAASFDEKDYQPLLKYARKVRETHNQGLVDNFNLACNRKWNDHTNVSINGLELLHVAKSDDLVVTAGTTLLIDQILGTSVTRWRYLAFGTSNATPTAAQIALQAETAVVPRVDMSLFGWREYAFRKNSSSNQ